MKKVLIFGVLVLWAVFGLAQDYSMVCKDTPWANETYDYAVVMAGFSSTDMFIAGDAMPASGKSFVHYDGTNFTPTGPNCGVQINYMDMKMVDGVKVGHAYGGNKYFSYNASSQTFVEEARTETWGFRESIIVSATETYFINSDARFVKKDASGWTTLYDNSSSYTYYFTSLCQDDQGDMWVAGYYYPGPTFPDNASGFLCKWDGTNMNTIKSFSVGFAPVKMFSDRPGHLTIVSPDLISDYDISANTCTPVYTIPSNLVNAMDYMLINAAQLSPGNFLLTNYVATFSNQGGWHYLPDFSPPGVDIWSCGVHNTYILAPRAICQIDQLSEVEQYEKEDFSVYPNPSSGLVYIDKEVKDAQLLDMSGRIVASPVYMDGKTMVDLSAMAPGMYLLKGYLNGQPITKKLVRE